MKRPSVIAKLWASDLTNLEIAMRAGYRSVSWMQKIALRLGLPKRKPGPKSCHAAAGYQHHPPSRVAAVDPVARAWRCIGCNGLSDTAAGHPSCVERAA